MGVRSAATNKIETVSATLADSSQAASSALLIELVDRFDAIPAWLLPEFQDGRT